MQSYNEQRQKDARIVMGRYTQYLDSGKHLGGYLRGEDGDRLRARLGPSPEIDAREEVDSVVRYNPSDFLQRFVFGSCRIGMSY